jgi:hypothetical protein
MVNVGQVVVSGSVISGVTGGTATEVAKRGELVCNKRKAANNNVKVFFIKSY